MADQDFWDELSANKARVEKEELSSPFAKDNITGITSTLSANIELAAPVGKYADLNKDVGLDLLGSVEDWEKTGSSEQGIIDTAINTFFGGVVNMAAGVVAGVASNDVLGIYNTSLGNTEEEYSNVLFDFSKKMMEYGQERFHIYSSPNESIFSTSYIGKQLQSLGYSTGLIAEMFGEQALITAATEGMGLSISLPAAAAKYGKLSKLPSMISKQALFGSFQGIKESYINALETGESTYKKFKDVGYEDAEAKKKANEAATMGFRMEVLPLMTMNALQFASLAKHNPFNKVQANTGFSGAIETVANKSLSSIKSPKIKKLSSYFLNIASEAVEEGIQTGISKEAQYRVGLAESIVGERDFGDRITEDHEMRDSMIGGAMGGGVFKLMGDSFNKLVGKDKRTKKAEENYDEYVGSIASRIESDTRDLKEAYDKESPKNIEAIKKRMQRQNVLESLQYDLMNQKETAFNTYVSTLEQKYKAATSNDVEELKKVNIETAEDVQHIKEFYPVFIQDAKDLRAKLVKNLSYIEDETAAFNVTFNEKSLEELILHTKESETTYSSLQKESVPYSNLTDAGKNTFNLSVEKAAIEYKREANNLTSTQTARLNEINTELRESTTLITSSDKNILKGISSQEFVKEKINSFELNETQNIVAEKVEYWKDPVNQVKEAKERAQNIIRRSVDKAASKAQLTKVKTDLENKNILDKETKEILNDKIEKAEVVELEPATASSNPFMTRAINPDKKVSKKRSLSATKLADLIEAQSDLAVLGYDDKFSPSELISYNDTISEKLKIAVKDYYENLEEDLNRVPSFQEFIKDFIKHNDRSTTDKIYNALVEGWKSNEYLVVNFDDAYKNIFKDRKTMSSDIVGIASEMIGSSEPSVKSEVIESNDKVMEEIVNASSPIVEVNDNNNLPELRDTNPYRTTTGTLKAAYLSVLYKRMLVEEDGVITITDIDLSDDLNNSDDVNSIKLLDPNLFNAGTKLTVRIPDNYQDISVGVWSDDITKIPALKFGDWVTRYNIKEGSPEWVNKVPMIAYDKDGEGVFFIHDTQWYNPINVGFKEDLKKQYEVIQEGRSNLTTTRQDIYNNNKLDIEVTEKRPGTWQTINNSKEPIPINQTNPDSVLAIADDKGVLRLNGEEVFETKGRKLLNSKDNSFSRGHTYDVRRASNKNEYTAFDVFRYLLTPETQTTVAQAIKTYIYRLNTDTEVFDSSNIRDHVLSSSGFDLHNSEDLENFLSLYIQVVSGKFSSKRDIYNQVERNSEIPVGTPYISLQDHAIVFGEKGKKMSPNSEVLYMHPDKVNDTGGIKSLKALFKTLDSMMGGFTQNTSRKGLIENRTTVSIKEDGGVLPQSKYRDNLKDVLKTTILSHNIGTKELPNYVTNIQPVINFKKIDNTFKKFVDTGVVSQEVVKSIADKIVSGEVLSSEEQAMRVEVANEVEAILVEENTEEINEYIRDERIEEVVGLSIIQEFQLVDYVFNQLSLKVDFKYKTNVSRDLLMKEIKDSYDSLVKPRKDSVVSKLTTFKSEFSIEPTNSLKNDISYLELELKYIEVAEANWTAIENNALSKLYKYTGITEVLTPENVDLDSEGVKEKNYSKTSLEENGKTTTSYRLKRFFSGVEKVDSIGTPIKGFLSVPTYVGFDTVYSTVEQIISSPYEVDSNFNLMIARLEENTENYQWLNYLIGELKNSDQQIKNEFTYNFARHALSMKFVMFSKGRDGLYTLKVYDTNANEITRVIRRQWDSNFKQSPLTMIKEDKIVINVEKAKSLLETFEDWSNTSQKKNIPNSELISWLGDFGLTFNDNTLSELKNKETNYVTKQGKEKIGFNDMFEKSSSTAGIFGLLANYLDNVIGREDTSFEDNPVNHPFNNATNVLKTIAKIESKYTMFATTNSFRDGNKSIYGFTPTKHATDVVKKLKYDQNFRDKLSTKSYNKHSYLLDLLNNDESFQNKFHIDHIGITAMKELGTTAFGDNSITSLSDADHEITKLGLFQDTEQGDINSSLGENSFINLRMARMFLPTMSDKSQMLALYTAVLDLKNKHFSFSDTGKLTLKDELVDVLYTQLVSPELERITNFHSTIGETDIKGYDMAAQLFLMLPSLNNLYDPESKKRVISLMKENPSKYNLNWFTSSIKGDAKNMLTATIESKINDKLTSWNDNGIATITEQGGNPKLLDKNYMKGFQGTSKEKITLAAADFVINSMLTNANSHMLLSGDIALYSQDKISKYFQNGNPALPKEEFGDNAYSTLSREVVSTNLGKRLALLLAPGNKLANSKDSEYNQVFLEDFVDISSNIVELVKIFHGQVEATKVKPIIDKYNSTSSSDGKRKIAKSLAKMYPSFADYFDIEATDAQEYTTLTEHIDVMFGQGRLSEKEYSTIQGKIALQFKSENDNNSIPNEAMLSYAELKKVFQPLKPVYTGFKEEARFDVMRMMYVKSSSFPLIPQVTKGTELDNLRILMENFEATSGKNVRASYNSANKVGAIKNPIVPFNPDGTFNNKLTLEDFNNSSLTLSREGFRIQQDIPFKAGKTTEDKVSLGTQPLKLLFGDGIMDISGFVLDGETFNGKELHKEFNKTYDDYIKALKSELFEELGVDENGNAIDAEQTAIKLQDLLKKEAEGRGYPKQTVKALDIIKIENSTGEVVSHKFEIPLWLTPDSNRFESLLNSIVTNRLVNIKLPGNSYVVGSETGFKVREDLEGVDQSRIIYTNTFDTELKAYTKNNLTQVLLPSRIRDNSGALIELIDSKGDANSLYVERDDKGMLRLKEDMIDKELLQLTSFRVPTSSHVSMAQVEIVGILPPEVGDLMIVPKNLTKQKGLDFDIDKETTYKLHTYVNAEGEVKVLDKAGKEKLLNPVNDSYDRLIQAIFGDGYNFTEEEIAEDSILSRASKKLDLKLYENKILKIHSSVLSNSSNEVQKKINKVLSMDFAKSQAELIQSEREKGVDNTYFTLLDDSFQKSKMALGSSGKLGIGVYSNYIVFHSMIQQTLEPIQLMTVDEDRKPVPYTITIGNVKSEGLLGQKNALGNQKDIRSIAEVFAERQNTATDNEKEQIMGRVNVNALTINVDSLLAALGFDSTLLKDKKTRVSIPYLLLSQPILIEYVKEISRTQSNTTAYDPTAKIKIVTALREKYKVTEEYNKSMASKLLTGQTLFDNLTSSQNIIQTTVLDTFLQLDEYATNISGLQKKLNINNTGLGKSNFETVDKYYGVQNITTTVERGDTAIKNASKLVGDYVKKNTKIDVETLKSEGYVEFSEYLIKPNNPVGSMLVNSVHAGYNLWKDYFPYDDPNVRLVFTEILKQVSDATVSDRKKVELQQEIFTEMKKSFVSSNRLGVFSGNPQENRNRLFIDSSENTSLAKYLSGVINDKTVDLDVLKNNKLISRFEYQLNKNGLPSLIRFDNTKGENFDEDYLYASLLELIDLNIPLPTLNGNNYTSKDLANDLVSYSYLEGGIQEAIQFVKYVPIDLLNLKGFGEVSREWDNTVNPNIFGALLGVKINKEDVSVFTRQYLQHNPKRLMKLDISIDIIKPTYLSGKKDIKNLLEFSVNLNSLSEEQLVRLGGTDFVTIYSPNIEKGFSKFAIFEKSGDTFRRISSLGVFGMSEYSIGNDDVKSLVNSYHKAEKVVKTSSVEAVPKGDIFGVNTLTVSEIVNNIAEYNFLEFPELATVAKTLASFVPNDLSIEINNLTNKNGDVIGKGHYKNNVITLDRYHLNTSTNEDTAKTILHEVVHALTSDYISQYLNSDGTSKVDNLPSDIVNLIVLFNEAKKQLGSEVAPLTEKLALQKAGETKEGTTERERTVVYGVTSVDEFVTLMLTEPKFQKEMMDLMYKKSGISIFDKLSVIVDSIMKTIFGNAYTVNGVTYDGIRTSLEIIKSQATQKMSPQQSMRNSDAEAESLLTGFNSFDTSYEKEDIRNPFKCI